MVYKVIGLMSGSSLDGLDIAYVHLQERVGASQQAPRVWDFQLVHTDCSAYSPEWRERLAGAGGLSALEYLTLHAEYGHYLGREVLRFIGAYGLDYQVQLIASHGHTTFHYPVGGNEVQRMEGNEVQRMEGNEVQRMEGNEVRRMEGNEVRRMTGMTAQLGDGASIAAETRINVVSDLRALDVALGGQGAPIVPIGEKLLFPEYGAFLNLGGIANVSLGAAAFDVAPANRVLNALAGKAGLDFDRDGLLAATGRVDEEVLRRLDGLAYYGMGWPKSLANEFGLLEVLPLVEGAGLSVEDGLRTYVEHLVGQIGRAAERLGVVGRMLVTGGGAHNGFLVGRLRARLAELGVEVVVPDAAIVDYKEALVMALIGVLRWREENNVLASVTGASRDSIGGAVWIGQEV
jgi:anhydro-N-acetylmuramic acid kinase